MNCAMKYNKKLAESDRVRDLKRFELEKTQEVEGWGIAAPSISQESGLSVQLSDTSAGKRYDAEKAGKQLKVFYQGKPPSGRQHGTGKQHGTGRQHGPGTDTVVGAVENGENIEEEDLNHPTNVEINAFDFLQSEAEENVVVCPSWQMPLDEYSCCDPGCIGFNGHQAVFHCFKPGQASLRKGSRDKCTLKLSSLPSGVQICTIIYDTPPVPKLKFPPREVCSTDRAVWVDFEDLCAVPPEPVLTPPAAGKGGAKGKNGNGNGKKGKGKK